jgi:hypothetical protein
MSTRNLPLPHHRRTVRELQREEREHKEVSRELQIVGAVFVCVLIVQMPVWDEEERSQFRAEADHAHENAVRYLVERSGYRDVYASAFHCRAPLEDERLVMQLANPRDPGKGYRCTYWMKGLDQSQATVTWSRSPDVVRYVDLRKAP